MRCLIFLSALAFYACDADPPPPAAAPATPATAAAASAAPASRATRFPEPPTDFERVIGTSEKAAATIQKTAAKALCAGMLARDPSAIEAPLADGLQAQNAGKALDRFGFTAALLAEAERWQSLERCSLKAHGFRLSTNHASAWARFELRLAGQRDGKRATARGWLIGALEGEPWRFVRADLSALSVQATDGRPFLDISAQTGVGLRDDRVARKALSGLANSSLIETIGGVGVVDWNVDGRPDLLAWNRRRVLALFVNDGNGGFERRADLIPPGAVGLFQLMVDLDGDGRKELVSTELTGCTRGQRQLSIYARKKERLEAAATLGFAGDCTHHRDLTYQHIAAHDIDGDGDLDLFVSGYGSRDTNMGGYNKFDTARGQRNLLFVNEGGLRFKELSAERGLSGTRFSYGATFFDYEGDGDPDLYVVNDYGPNTLYLNDGKGQFTRREGTLLTRHGQSMGVTVGDFDGDLDLDVYVSNMYSKAGHRIVPLVDDRMAEATRTQLMRLAEGNALYTQVEPGKYVETAQPAGLNRAGWAWGQAWFDHDNDGDRDLYVVNGMTSHDQIREHDY